MFSKNSSGRKKLLLFIICLCVGGFIYLQFLVVRGPANCTPVKSDAILILGHSINSEGYPEPWLLKRLEEGLRLYQQEYAEKIIVSGGEGPNDTIAVARSMENWLVDHGVDKQNIMVEEQSKNTYENFKYARRLMDEAVEQELSPVSISVIVVTNDFHLYRSMAIGSLFFEELSGSPAMVDMSPRKLLAYLKEPFSIVKYTVVGLFSGSMS